MKPRLGVAYDASSASPLQIANALGDDSELTWIVDTGHGAVGAMGRLLERTGTVIDLAGRQVEAVDTLSKGSLDGVVAFTDSQLPIAAAVAERLGLPGNGIEATRQLLDKVQQRMALCRAGIDVPELVEISGDMSPAELQRALETIKFPAVLKPRLGSGSRDMHHLQSADHLLALFAEGRSKLRNEEHFLVEEYLPDRIEPSEQVVGDYVSIEGVAIDGEVHSLAVTGKFPLAEPYRETGNFMPSGLDEAEALAAAELANRAARALAVRYGALHTEVKLTPAGPRLIEVNARVAGGGIDDLYAMRHGVSLLRIAGRAALGMPPPEARILRERSVVYQLFVQPPIWARRIARIGGLSQIQALDGVVQLYVARSPGDPVDWRVGSQGYVLSVRGRASDHEALVAQRAAVCSALDCSYDRS